jgi:hypothetical protein
MPPNPKDKGITDIGKLDPNVIKKLTESLTTTATSTPAYLTKVLIQSTLKAVADKLPNPEKKIVVMMADAVTRDITNFISSAPLPNKEVFELVFAKYLGDLRKRGGGGGGDDADAQILQGP